MEDYIIILALSIASLTGLTALKMMKPNQGKNKQKTRKDSAVETLDRVNEETIERLADQLKKESGRANRLQALKDKLEDNAPEPEENGQKQVTFEEIEVLVKQTYPKYALMLPVMKKQIMEITKGMSLEQVLDYVKQITGNKQIKPGDPTSITNEGFNPNYA